MSSGSLINVTYNLFTYIYIYIYIYWHRKNFPLNYRTKKQRNKTMTI